MAVSFITLFHIPLVLFCIIVYMHCATSRKVPGSIPGVAGFFFPWHLTVPCALESTEPLKMSTRLFLGVKAAGA
jgi:hypothetical protein